MLRPYALFLLLLAVNAAAQQMPATTRTGIEQLRTLSRTEPDPAKLTLATQGNWPTAYVHGHCSVGFLARVDETFDAATVDTDVVRIGSRKKNILSFRVDAYHLEALATITGLEYVELAGKVAPQLDKAVKSMRADSVQQGINLPQTYTGRDVLIGVLDWGFDYTHPMFYDTALTASRVRAAWDQWRQAGPAPSGFSYGTELATTDALMAAQSDTVCVYGDATHGSHVAGIAGGGGAGTNYRGVAFDAHFLFCTFLVDAASVLDAFAWMQQVAEQDDKRLVVNMSWGLYYIGTLDGTSLISQAIDAYSADGIAFVNSGGNNGDVDFHIKKEFNADTLLTRVQFYGYNLNPNMWGQSISMWGEPGNAFSVGMSVTNGSWTVLSAMPWYSTATQTAYVDSFLVIDADTVFYNLACDAAHPLNGRPHARLRVKNTATARRILLRATATNGTVHFWNVTELSNGVGNWGMGFLAGPPGATAGDNQYGISEPACTESLISVAAYSSDYYNSGGNQVGGAIAAFSSYGPTLDERLKPDIAAPGVNVASSISSFTDDDYTQLTSVEFNGADYPFARFSGTSMASPGVTGVVALMLEADPDITPAAIKELIKGNARTDEDTGVIPPGGSTRWGMGKVNAYRAVCAELGVIGLDETQQVSGGLWPNPVSGTLYMRSPFQGQRVELLVMDAAGRCVQRSARSTGAVVSLDVSALLPGMYVLKATGDHGTHVRAFVKE